MNEKQSTGILSYKCATLYPTLFHSQERFRKGFLLSVLMFCCPQEEAQEQNCISIKNTDKRQK